jgi:hypothetical protein
MGSERGLGVGGGWQERTDTATDAEVDTDAAADAADADAAPPWWAAAPPVPMPPAPPLLSTASEDDDDAATAYPILRARLSDPIGEWDRAELPLALVPPAKSAPAAASGAGVMAQLVAELEGSQRLQAQVEDLASRVRQLLTDKADLTARLVLLEATPAPSAAASRADIEDTTPALAASATTTVVAAAAADAAAAAQDERDTVQEALRAITEQRDQWQAEALELRATREQLVMQATTAAHARAQVDTELAEARSSQGTALQRCRDLEAAVTQAKEREQRANAALADLRRQLQQQQQQQQQAAAASRGRKGPDSDGPRTPAGVVRAATAAVADLQWQLAVVSQSKVQVRLCAAVRACTSTKHRAPGRGLHRRSAICRRASWTSKSRTLSTRRCASTCVSSSTRCASSAGRTWTLPAAITPRSCGIAWHPATRPCSRPVLQRQRQRHHQSRSRRWWPPQHDRRRMQSGPPHRRCSLHWPWATSARPRRVYPSRLRRWRRRPRLRAAARFVVP